MSRVRTPLRVSGLLFLGVIGATSLPAMPPDPAPAAPTATTADRRRWFEADWRFSLGDHVGAETPSYDDASWRTLDLPHDWSIEGQPSAHEPSAGGGGFFPTGIGWYRKHFVAPTAWHDRHVWIEFEGVYRNSDVWVNGHLLGHRPNGFANFRYELTPYLRFSDRSSEDAANVVTVRVDNSAQPNSRYYTGSGINRPVRLRIAGPTYVVPDSLVVETQSLTATSAALVVRAEIARAERSAAAASATVAIVDPSGNQVAAVTVSLGTNPNDNEPQKIGVRVAIPTPQAWSLESPALYTAIVSVGRSDQLDRAETHFGIRTIQVSATNGFLLNGQPLKLFGGNVHDDNGPLGTAAFDRAEQRRAELLKQAGFNAVRTAHNPPAPAFLDACDRLGLLVIEEAFDGWKRAKVAQDYSRDFDAWAERDLAAMIRRDRNHPSVVLWSVGNEPYERTKPSGVEIARRLVSRAHELDPTRPVTAGVNGPGKGGEWTLLDPLFAAFDVAGYNYESGHVDSDHARLPQRVTVATESYLVDAFASWSTVHDHSFVIGDFVWSAMDYLGEAGIGRIFQPGEPIIPHWEGSHFPWHGAACGDLDLIGDRRPLSHYRAIVWDRGERLYAAVQIPTPDGRPWGRSLWAPTPLRSSWTWPGQEGRELQVEVYSRHDSVRLYLNGRPRGEKPTGQAEEFKAVFAVPYAPGELRVVGLDAGRPAETFTLLTAGPAAAIRLHGDRTVLTADGQDLAFVSVAITDDAGRTVPDATDEVTYALTGPGEIAAIGNADLTNDEGYRGNPHRTYEGRALVVIRTRRGPGGEIVLRATTPGVPSSSLTLHSRTR